MLLLLAGMMATIVISFSFTIMRLGIRAGRMVFGAKIIEHRPLPHHRICKMNREAFEKIRKHVITNFEVP